MDFCLQSDLRKEASVAFSSEKCYHRSVFSKQVLCYEDTKRIKARDLSMHEALGLTGSTDRKRKRIKEWAVWVIEFRLGGERLKRY